MCGYKQKNTQFFVRYHKKPPAGSNGVRLFCETHGKISFVYEYFIF